jgi:hypothetical protein
VGLVDTHTITVGGQTYLVSSHLSSYSTRHEAIDRLRCLPLPPDLPVAPRPPHPPDAGSPAGADAPRGSQRERGLGGHGVVGAKFAFGCSLVVYASLRGGQHTARCEWGFLSFLTLPCSTVMGLSLVTEWFTETAETAHHN